MNPPYSIGLLSYGAGALAFTLLTLLLLTAWRGRLTGGLLVAASGTNAIWCAVLASYSMWDVPPYAATLFVETVRGTAWLLFLLALLGYAKRGGERFLLPSGATVTAMLGFCVGLASLNILLTVGALPVVSLEAGGRLLLFGHVLLAVFGLVLVEQLYRNTRPQYRWSVKLLCVGLGGLFVYDFYMYADALLLNRVQPEVWEARGIINVVLVPMIALTAVRNPHWSLEVFVSRHVVFHTATLLGAGLYLLLMAAAGYWIRSFGGTWGGIAQAVFLFGALVLLALMLSSGHLRSRAKVFLGKHFFRNKYDYREEWLRFTQALSSSAEVGELRDNIVRAIADIMESPGGVLWMRRDSGDYHLAVGSSSLAVGEESGIVSRESSLPKFLADTGWVIYLDEYRRDPTRYEGLELPAWLRENRRAWLIVPLVQADEVTGFLLLLRSESKTSLDWEDSDLLKTLGRQAASYLALVQLTEALTDARQFEAFNRLSAYVVHDLKNLVAQLSLVVSNSRRHRDSPGFIEDALATVENATNRMNRLLAQLRKGQTATRASRRVALATLLRQVVDRCGNRKPSPRLDIDDEGIEVAAEPERLASVLEHLVENAQEATPEAGEVRVRLRRDDETRAAVIEIADTGCGMDSQFIAERLFRPFETTKGNAGMGIGVYESREFVLSLGGRIDVSSRPGEGTVFKVVVPLIDAGNGHPGADIDAGLEMAD